MPSLMRLSQRAAASHLQSHRHPGTLHLCCTGKSQSSLPQLTALHVTTCGLSSQPLALGSLTFTSSSHSLFSTSFTTSQAPLEPALTLPFQQQSGGMNPAGPVSTPRKGFSSFQDSGSSSSNTIYTPATPKPESGDEAPTTPATGVKKTPRKRAAPKVYNKLSTAVSNAAPVDVSFENNIVHSKPLPKDAGHGQTVKLAATQPFELVGSFLLENGLQAIIVKPSARFPFTKLPKDIPTRILSLNLAPTTKGRIEIVTESKSGNVKTKDYSLLGTTGEMAWPQTLKCTWP